MREISTFWRANDAQQIQTSGYKIKQHDKKSEIFSNLIKTIPIRSGT